MVDHIRSGLGVAKRLDVSVSFVRFSGVQLIIDALKDFLARGGEARLLTSTYMGITQPEALRALSGLKGLECRVQISSKVGFHPKIYLFLNDDSQGWVGSSNLSKGGLVSNIEANLMASDHDTVNLLSSSFDELWNRSDVFNVDSLWIDTYAAALLRQISRHQFISPPPPFSSTVTPIERDQQPTPNQAQTEALRALANLRSQSENRAVVIAAPGVGKTYLAAFDAFNAKAKRVLFVSHRLEHLVQAQQTFAKVFPQSTTGIVGAGRSDTAADLVFCTIQSLGSKLSELLDFGAFDYVVIDEFHHAAAQTYRRAIEDLQPGFLLGLTATPERQDGHDILELCDYNIAYEVRLVEAVNNGWLLPFHYFGIGDSTVDWETIKWRNRAFNVADLETALAIEKRVDLILEHATEKGYDGNRRATVGFCAGVRHANFMAVQLNERGFCAAALTGEDSIEVRQATYAQFADPNHPLEWLFVADLLNEGVDIPAINSLLFLRPTDSATVFIQQLGRGLRLTEGSEVLTVLDFVGHHRNAWLALEAISDRTASTNITTVLSVTPPRDCEIILDDLTKAILSKVKRFVGRKRDSCQEAYELLRDESGPPFPIDLWGRLDMPEFSDFRSTFGTWLKLRVEMGDETAWERSLDENSTVSRLFAICEKDWQQSRVYAYALIWALLMQPTDPVAGYEAFFARFPKWLPEYKQLDKTNAWITVEKQFGELIVNQRLAPDIFQVAPSVELGHHVESRIRLTLEKDFKLRHGGVLKSPDALRVHGRYSRNEIVNHFGVQYDPARHNLGVIKFPQHIVIITKLDTDGAKSEFQYKNVLLAPDLMQWQSQNQQRQANSRYLLDHKNLGTTIHMFVQRRSHSEVFYLGPVNVVAVEGNGPMTVNFQLQHRVGLVAADLNVTFDDFE